MLQSSFVCHLNTFFSPSLLQKHFYLITVAAEGVNRELQRKQSRLVQCSQRNGSRKVRARLALARIIRRSR